MNLALNPLKAKVIKLEAISSVLVAMRFAMVEPTAFNFKSGQFISIILPDSHGLRSYSISSLEDNKISFELTINIFDRSQGGAGVDYLSSLRLNDVINFIGPYGTLTLKDSGIMLDNIINTNIKGMIWIGTGSGIAPIKAMAEHFNYALAHQKLSTVMTPDKETISTIPNILYFGIRNENEACYQEEFEKIQKVNSQFKFRFCMSQAPDGDLGPNRFKGYVTPFIIKDLENVNDKDKFHFYLCGKTAIIQSIIKELETNGFNKANMHFEYFG